MCFYIAQYSVRWTAQSAFHFSSYGKPVHSGTNSASPRSILARQQLRATTKSLTCPIYSQVLIYTAESTGASVKRTKMPNLRNGSKGLHIKRIVWLIYQWNSGKQITNK